MKNILSQPPFRIAPIAHEFSFGGCLVMIANRIFLVAAGVLSLQACTQHDTLEFTGLGESNVYYFQRSGLPDVNCDGKADLVLAATPSTSPRVILRFSNGTGFYGYSKVQLPANIKFIQMGDVNGDGNDDLVVQAPGHGTAWRWLVYLSNGVDGFEEPRQWAKTATTSVGTLDITDLDGDGKKDLLLWYRFRGEDRAQGRISDGGKFVGGGRGADWWTSPITDALAGVMAQDVNADGKTDLILWYRDYRKGKWYEPKSVFVKQRWVAMLSTGSSFTDGGPKTETGSKNVFTLAGDVNADGKSDLLLVYKGGAFRGPRYRWQARPSTGATYESAGHDWATETEQFETIGLAGFGGNGRDSLLLQREVYSPDRREWKVRLSTGGNRGRFVDSGVWTATKTKDVRVDGIGDLSGDGKDDILLRYILKKEIQWQPRISDGTKFIASDNWASDPKYPGEYLTSLFSSRAGGNSPRCPPPTD